MSNKKISFSWTAPKQKSLEVYRDISMVAVPNEANVMKTYKQVIPMAYLASDVATLKTSYLSAVYLSDLRPDQDLGTAGKQLVRTDVCAYTSLSSFLNQTYRKSADGKAWPVDMLSAKRLYIVERDPKFEPIKTQLSDQDGNPFMLTAGSQFLVGEDDVYPKSVSKISDFTSKVTIRDYGSLSGRLLYGEMSSPSVPNQGVLLALQYADAYYEVQYSNDLCSVATFLSGRNDATLEGSETPKAYVDDETRYKLMILENSGAVSTYAEWKQHKAWNPYKLSKLVNVDAVYNSLRNLFTWVPGERILDPSYGSDLRTYLYQGITDVTSKQIVAEINRAIGMWEPRVSVEKVVDMTTDEDRENNIIQIDIVFSIPSLSREQFHYTYTWHQTD